MNSVLASIKDRPPDYQDDFSDPGSGWPIGRRPPNRHGHEGGILGYENGEYFIVADEAMFPWEADPSKKITCLSAYRSPAVEVLEFVIEVDVRFVTENTGGDAQIKFWKQNPYYYGVRIDPTGLVSFISDFPFQENLDANDRWYTKYTPSTQERVNHVVIVAKDSKIAVTLNNYIVVFMDNLLPQEQGPIGLGVCNFGVLPFRTQFDNLRVWDISK